MKSKLLLLLAFLLTGTVFIYAQESEQTEKTNQLDIDLQLRPRAEYRNGYKFPHDEGDKGAGLINQRSRLTIDYQREGLSARLGLQNVSIWGQYPVSNAYRANTTIYEAWAQLKSKDGFFMKFGRQVLHYNDGRLLSIADWNQASRSHDALKFGYQTSLHQLDAILAFNQHQDIHTGGTYYNNSTGVPYKTMQAAYYQNNQIANFTPSVIFINVGLENGDALTGESRLANLQTFGTNLVYKPLDDLRLTGIAYYQMGDRPGIGEKTAAYFLGMKGDYELTNQLRLTAATEFMSGEEHNSPHANSTYNAFYPLYAGNHGLYGVMDYFVDVGYLNGMNLGIWDNYLGVSYRPTKKITLGATYHYFLTGSEVYGLADEKLKRGLGSEIDLQFGYDIMRDVKLICGYSTFFGTPTMDYVKGGDHKHWQDWAVLTINVNPRIFSTKW